MKNEMTAAEFRELVKNGQISAGKKGRLKLNEGAGATISSDSHKSTTSTQIKSHQGKIRHPGQGRTISQIQSDRYKNEIKIILNMLRIDYHQEFKFDTTGRRKFRFDFYVETLKLGIEFEGIGFSKDGTARKSRHTSVTGYTMDCTKYNLATSQGYRILRYTAKNIHEITDDLRTILASDRTDWSKHIEYVIGKGTGGGAPTITSSDY